MLVVVCVGHHMSSSWGAGVRVDVWSYSALIKGFVQSGDIHEARELLDDMRAEGVKPNEVIAVTTHMY